MIKDSTIGKSTPVYGGRRLEGDALGSSDIPPGSSALHVLVIRLRRLLEKEHSLLLSKVGGISIAEWRVLHMLALVGRATQGELLEKIVIEQAQASRVMKAMQDAGLVDMERNRKDRRRWVCSLTDAGRALHDRVEPVVSKRSAAIDSLLNSNEHAQFIDFANRLTKYASESLDQLSAEDEPSNDTSK